MANRSFYLISYDIPDDKRRLKIMHLLEGYGERVQYSVFEIWATDKELEKLKSGLAKWIKPRQGEQCAENAAGSVRLYTLCAACQGKRAVMGAGAPTAEPGLLII